MDNHEGDRAAASCEKKTSLPETRTLLILLAFAALLQVISTVNTRVISSDGPRYIHVAQFYRDGNFARALDDPYHPVLPGLMALGSFVTGSLETSGQAWSVLLGSLALVPLFMFCRKAFSFRVAVATCLLYSCAPYVVRYGSQVFTTGIFLFCVSAAVWLAYEASIRNSPFCAIASGLAATLGYLTRVDGLVIVGGLFMWLAVVSAWSTQTGRRTSPLLAAAFLIPFVAIAGPYIAFLSGLNGRFTVTRKFQIGQLAGAQPADISTAQPASSGEEADAAAPPDRPATQTPTFCARLSSFLSPVMEVLKDALWVFHVLVILLILIGFAVYRRSILHNRGSMMLVGLSLLMFAAMCVVASRLGINKRRVLPILPILVPFAGMGAEAAARWIASAVARTGTRLEQLAETSDWAGRRTVAPATTIAVTILACLIMLPKTMHAEGKDKLWERQIGEGIWATARTSPPLIMPEYVRICYYAGGRGIYLNDLNDRSYDSMIDFARHSGVEFIIASDLMDEISPGFSKRISPNDMEPVFSVKTDSTSNQTITVYRLLYHPKAFPER